MRIDSVVLTLFLGSVLVSSEVSAATTSLEVWEAHLKVSDGLTGGRLSFGTRPDASAGYDPQWDVRSLTGSGLRAYFYHPGWPQGDYYDRDIRAPGLPQSFPFKVAAVPVGRTVVVRWDLRFVPKGCERVDLALVDEATGARVDMRLTDAYSFVHQGGVYGLHVEATRAPQEPVPNAPELAMALDTGRAGQVLLRWRAPLAGAPAVAYNVYRRAGDGTLLLLNDEPQVSLLYRDRTAGEAGVGATYFVRGLNAQACEGPTSEEVSTPYLRLSAAKR